MLLSGLVDQCLLLLSSNIKVEVGRAAKYDRRYNLGLRPGFDNNEMVSKAHDIKVNLFAGLQTDICTYLSDPSRQLR